MKPIVNPQKIEELLIRGIEEIIHKDRLKKKLLSGKKLRVKHGVDPTGPNIHLGRVAQLLKLRDFQELGHQIILIIGDFTAQIGDASDKTSARRPLSEKEVQQNMKNYLPQISKILDIKKTEIYYNSRWLSRLTIKNLLLISMKFTAQQMIQRRNFKERWEKEKPIGLHELYYPLFQGYDSVAIRADVEIGGFDQLFNLKTGRMVQKFFGQKPQDIMTLKMIVGPDGRKMSTSWQNVINISDDPQQIYGMIMSMEDKLLPDYFELCARIPFKELEVIKKDLEQKKVNPRDVKTKLAKQIVALFHGEKAAQVAEKEFEKVFREKKLPSKVPEAKIQEDILNILDLLTKTKLASSMSEAKRLILQGGVKIKNKNQESKVKNDWKEEIKIKEGTVIQVGKRKFVKIKK